MRVGAGDGVDAAPARMLHHVEEGRIDIGFALEIEGEGPEGAAELIDHAVEEILLQVAGGPGEGAQAARAFGAAQVAGRGGLDADADRKAHDHRVAAVARTTVTAPYRHGVARARRTEGAAPFAN